MLVLTRRNGESLLITKNICVCVLGIKGNQVRLGITAPEGVPIYREEVREMFERDGAVELLLETVRTQAAPEPALASKG